MYKIKFFVLAAILAALLLSALRIDGAAQANAPVPAVTFTYERLSTIEAGEVWTDRHGMHIRNRVDLGLLTGDLQGSARVVYNADLVFTTSGLTQPSVPPDDGVAYGTIEIYSGQLETAVPFWNGSWAYDLLDGRVVGGSLTATDPSETLTLVVISVIQGRNGIVHTGHIDQSFCPDAICEKPSDQ